MDKKEKLEFISKNRNKTIKQLANDLGLSPRSIRRYERKLGFPPRNSIDLSKNEISVEGNKNIEFLLQENQIDLSEWTIERVVANKWDTATKQKTKENKQTKIWLKKKITEFDQNFFKKEILDFVKNYKSKSVINTNLKSTTKDGKLLLINLFDLHLGKIDLNNVDTINKTCKDVVKAVNFICNSIKHLPIDQIVLPLGNDFFNSDYDYPHPKTTLDTDITLSNSHDNFYKTFRRGRELFCDIITSLLNIAKVHVVTIPGNHDYQKIFYLSDAIECYFYENPNLSMDNTVLNRKYFKYGKNLLGFTHGKDEKHDSLAYIMPEESKQWWSKTNYRYWYLGHLHQNKSIKFFDVNSYPGISINFMPSITGTDHWHNKKGFIGEIKGCKAYIHDKNKGKVLEITHNI